MSEPLWFRAYGRLPIVLQNTACSLAGLRLLRERYGPVFRTALRFLETAERWSLTEQRAWQDERLREVVRHAYSEVPYWRETFDRLHLRPDDIRGADDLPKLPLLDKETVRRRGGDLRAAGWPRRRLRRLHTGGTTGKALDLVCDRDTIAWQWAVWWRHRRRFGARLGDPFVVFGGKNVVPLRRMDPPFWRVNRPLGQTYVSIHHLTRANMPALVDYLNSRRVRYYSGYPSGLYLLAAHLLQTGRRLTHPPGLVFTGSETLLPYQREALACSLGATVADQYGATEQCGNLSECEQHTYHVDMEFGIVELLPVAGLPDTQRRIVCTSLQNPAMPLLRYDIGDVAEIGAGPCACGRSAPTVTAIDGRIESYITTPDGRRLGRLDFLFKHSGRIVEAQLVQEAPDHVTIRIVRGENYGEEDERALLTDARRYLGGAMQIDLEPVAEIPREANGKFRQIVSRLLPNAMDVGG